MHASTDAAVAATSVDGVVVVATSELGTGAVVPSVAVVPAAMESFGDAAAVVVVVSVAAGSAEGALSVRLDSLQATTSKAPSDKTRTQC